MNILLEMINLDVVHSENIRLKNINIKISEGEKIALLGKSGAGKSTLISAANGTVNPSFGSVLWKGRNVLQISPRMRSELATLWQDLRLIEELNVCQNINSGALGSKNLLWALRNLLGSIEINECIKCAEAAGLEKEILNRNIFEISGGQKQRVAIAKAIRQEGEILLADEPISSLDPELIAKMIDLLLGNSTNNGIKIPNTVLVSLHQPELIYKFTRVIALSKGKVIIDKPSYLVSQKEIEWLYDKR